MSDSVGVADGVDPKKLEEAEREAREELARAIHAAAIRAGELLGPIRDGMLDLDERRRSSKRESQKTEPDPKTAGEAARKAREWIPEEWGGAEERAEQGERNSEEDEDLARKKVRKAFGGGDRQFGKHEDQRLLREILSKAVGGGREELDGAAAMLLWPASVKVGADEAEVRESRRIARVAIRRIPGVAEAFARFCEERGPKALRGGEATALLAEAIGKIAGKMGEEDSPGKRLLELWRLGGLLARKEEEARREKEIQKALGDLLAEAGSERRLAQLLNDETVAEAAARLALAGRAGRVCEKLPGFGEGWLLFREGRRARGLGMWSFRMAVG